MCPTQTGAHRAISPLRRVLLLARLEPTGRRCGDVSYACLEPGRVMAIAPRERTDGEGGRVPGEMARDRGIGPSQDGRCRPQNTMSEVAAKLERAVSRVLERAGCAAKVNPLRARTDDTGEPVSHSWGSHECRVTGSGDLVQYPRQCRGRV